MHEIPSAKNTDAEDVVWGLQTAETLWKRGERIDALVWLRRAAQAAGDANDDDRALELARHAAELTEWMAASDEPGLPIEDTSVDINVTVPPPLAVHTSIPTGGVVTASAAPASVAGEPEPEAEGERPSKASVPPAETVHAGMFDPWADARLAAAGKPPARAPRPSFTEIDEEEVVTSVRPATISRPEAVSVPPVALPTVEVVAPAPAPSRPAPPRPMTKPPVPKAPPPLPTRAKPPVPKAAAASPEPAPQVTTVTAPPSAEVAPMSLQSSDMRSIPPSAPVPADPPPAEALEAPAQHKLDLESVDAFADLPDDARAAFAAAARLHTVAEGDEIGSFALAYVVSGTFDVAATVVDAPAARLTNGAVLRARGTTDENVPIRLICANNTGSLATWSDAAVDEAFRSIPWVEQDLRAAADRIQTLVGITIGPLGERLDPSIREEIIGRLTMRPLIAGEIVVKEGEAVPGLLLVGIGELELVKADKVVGVVSSGDFLFATEVLGAGDAPSTARAGPGGALIMFGDRRIAQELLVTCPPLLELFAGM